MRFTKIFIFCALVLCFGKGMALKCRTSELRETNVRFERVMQRCRARISHQQNQNMNNENSSEEDSTEEDNYDDPSSTSDERDPSKKFINRRIGTTDASNSMRNPSPNDKRDQSNNGGRLEQNLASTSRPYPYNRMTNGSYGTGSALNDRLSRNMTWRSRSYNGMDNSGQQQMNNPDNHPCAIQCFFDELDLTDQRGFPEKFAVSKIMRESIQESQLQDFVERTVTDCFRMIEADRNKEPCRSSQHLLSCIASKGREGCEDWEE